MVQYVFSLTEVEFLKVAMIDTKNRKSAQIASKQNLTITIPQLSWEELLEVYYDYMGHLGIAQTLAYLHDKFWFP